MPPTHLMKVRHTDTTHINKTFPAVKASILYENIFTPMKKDFVFESFSISVFPIEQKQISAEETWKTIYSQKKHLVVTV